MVATIAGVVLHSWFLQHRSLVLANGVALYRPWLVPLMCAGMALGLAWFARRAETREDNAQPVLF